jgi:hypothetical protein
MANPLNIAIGPGILKLNPTLGSSEPLDLTSPWPAGWIEPGYTAEGSTFTNETTYEDVEVAEELDPVSKAATKRGLTVAFALAEITASNLKRIFNGGTITAGPGGCWYYDPPALGTEVYVMLGWEANDASERWIWRKCIQTGSVEVTRGKAPAKATLPGSFMLVKPPSVQPFRTILSAARA